MGFKEAFSAAHNNLDDYLKKKNTATIIILG
jgi:hypothetical protein